MADILMADRVAETTTDTGVGTPITLAGAKTGYQAFTDAFDDGDTVYYTITDGTDWEVGYGIFTSSGTTLGRTLLTSSTGSLISWTTGSKDVFCSAAANFLNDTFTSQESLIVSSLGL